MPSFLPAVILSEGCELDQMRYGCRIYNAQCSCGYGCKSEYRYNNNDDCKLALKGIMSVKSVVHIQSCWQFIYTLFKKFYHI